MTVFSPPSASKRRHQVGMAVSARPSTPETAPGRPKNGQGDSVLFCYTLAPAVEAESLHFASPPPCPQHQKKTCRMQMNLCKFTLTLFNPGGGGRFCPRRLWTLITFLILKQTLPNLATFFNIYLATICYDMSQPT